MLTSIAQPPKMGYFAPYRVRRVLRTARLRLVTQLAFTARTSSSINQPHMLSSGSIVCGLSHRPVLHPTRSRYATRAPRPVFTVDLDQLVQEEAPAPLADGLVATEQVAEPTSALLPVELPPGLDQVVIPKVLHAHVEQGEVGTGEEPERGAVRRHRLVRVRVRVQGDGVEEVAPGPTRPGRQRHCRRRSRPARSPDRAGPPC